MNANLQHLRSLPILEPLDPFRPLVDRLGRVHSALRISVTDLCNLRCLYCMPDQNVKFLSEDRVLSFDAIERLVQVMAKCGIRKVRLTGGEPLVRRNLRDLVGRLSKINGMEDIALTTNGMFLAEQVEGLVTAGLKRVNVSLDSLNDETFKRLTRRDGLEKVLKGIEAAMRISRRRADAGGQPALRVQLNALLLRDVNLDQLIPLVAFSRERDLPIRFIEFMPLDAERAWNAGRMVSAAETKILLEQEFGPMHLQPAGSPSQTARNYRFADGQGQVGFISPVSEPFCQACDRLRLTADGKLRNCLFGQQEWDLRSVLNNWASDTESADTAIAATIRACVAEKQAGHGIGSLTFVPLERTMHQIGG